jgi:hypothetical protein
MCDYCYQDCARRNAASYEASKVEKSKVWEGEQYCVSCRKPKPIAEFYSKRKRGGDGQLASQCSECREYGKNYAVKSRSKWSDEERRRDQEKKRNFARECRVKMLEAYGNKCTCCGETTPEFLAVDHVNNDGAHHRRTVVGYDPTALYRWAKKHGFPDSLQILCHNCNVAKAYYGSCPHQRAPE